MVEQYVGSVVAIGAVVGVLAGRAGGVVAGASRPATAGAAVGGHPPHRGRRPGGPGGAAAGRGAGRGGSLLQQMAATLERVEQLRRALVEDVAHELRTPLTTLRGYTEALAEGIVQPTPEMLRTVHAGDRAADPTSGSAGRPGPRRGAQRVSRPWRRCGWARWCGGRWRWPDPALQARDISVRIEEPEGLPALMADPDGIGQVVSNLVQNAVDYTTDGGEIAVAPHASMAAACDARSPTPARTSRPSSCP